MLIYLAVLLAATVLLSALLTPAVFMLLLQIWPEMPWPFSRVLDRVFLAVLIILIVAFRRRLNVREVFEALIWPGRVKAFLRCLLGLLLSFGSAWIATLILVELGELQWRGLSAGDIFSKFLKAVPAALLIAVIEEVFFRLLLLRALRRGLPVIAAAIVGSLIYAVLHFVTPDKSFQFELGNFTQGFTYTAVVVLNALQTDLLSPFIGLFLVGMLLAHVVYWQKSLIICIGLHAGWITALKLTSKIYSIQDVLPEHVLAARYYLVGQPLVWASFVIVLLVLTLISRTKFFKPADLR